jgi:hypothetical protein
MTKVNITAAEPNKAPSQPADGQQPAQQNQEQQNDQTNKDKPAQQK